MPNTGRLQSMALCPACGVRVRVVACRAGDGAKIGTANPMVDLNATPRNALALLLDRSFGPFFWGKVLSSAAIWIHSIVSAIAAYEVTRSALMVGLVGMAQFAPQAFAPLSGKMADRGSAPLQIVVGRLLSGAGSAGLAAWIWRVGGLDGLTGVLPVLLSSLIVGIGFVIGGPALQSVVPGMLRPGELGTALALNAVPMTTGRAAGPALGAFVATEAGAAAAFTIAAAANVTFGLIILALRLPVSNAAGSGVDRSVRESLRYVRLDRPLFLLLLGIAGVAVAAEPSVTLTPVLASELEGNAEVTGWLASAFGSGAFIGFLLFSPTEHRLGLPRLSSIGLVAMAVGLLGAAASGTTLLAAASFAISGIGMTFAFSSITTQIQGRIPDVMRGRIMALWYIGFLGARPFAAAGNGFIAMSPQLSPH